MITKEFIPDRIRIINEIPKEPLLPTDGMVFYAPVPDDKLNDVWTAVRTTLGRMLACDSMMDCFNLGIVDWKMPSMVTQDLLYSMGVEVLCADAQGALKIRRLAHPQNAAAMSASEIAYVALFVRQLSDYLKANRDQPRDDFFRNSVGGYIDSIRYAGYLARCMRGPIGYAIYHYEDTLYFQSPRYLAFEPFTLVMNFDGLLVTTSEREAFLEAANSIYTRMPIQ